MFKWGLFKKELQETHLPEDIREQMESIYSQFSGTDRVVLVMDQLTQIIRDQNKKLEELEKTSRKRQFQVERADKERNFQADLITSLSDEIQGPLNTINQL
ncbi:MAG: hypothetical protein GWM98_09670, partial [Nitrospinaceae bacterium]|nr:hypothetical protein [Nitrospinaceae bacterium]NIR54710.1 hypothetical protein [Nitrospinaceae bacterium]NIS85131.1 hypothetical protein [Nitrospinaceae bacterium]NIT81948.1 hypothetical protein [Nitrospinaceae bacterium]NIU44209.1 hypothetical protein [Nitrospinaceae bacterium]